VGAARPCRRGDEELEGGGGEGKGSWGGGQEALKNQGGSR
jgi:hypothetical protein